MSGERWSIIGASSAVARAFARIAAADGCDILLAGRDVDDLDRSAADLRTRYGVAVDVVVFDALDWAGQDDLARRIAASQAPESVFVALGAMPDQADSERDVEILRQVIDTNFTAVAALLMRLAPLWETRRSGRVVVLGSVAGDRGRYSNYAYGSAKAGLHAFLQGLRARLFHAGVPVLTVKPGFIDTAMTWGLKLPPLPQASPEDVARGCYAAAMKGRDEIYLPGFWWAILTVLRHVPERIFKRLKI